MRRYVIIGTGVAGISAAEAIREVDPHGSIILVGDEPDGYYSRPGLAYYLTGELPEKQLFPFTPEDFRRLNVRIVHDRALRVLPKQHQVLLAQHGALSYDRLLLATGSQAVMPPLPGIDLEGVVKLDTLPDARHILRLARRAKTAVVVGGGITALEIVEGLNHRGVKVHYLLRGDRYWRKVLDEQESRIVEERLRHEGVRIHYRTSVEAILGKKGRVQGVRTQDGQVIKAQIVALAIGVRPRLELAQTAGLQLDRGILVNDRMQSSDPDIFAAGDVAQVFDPMVGKPVLDVLWPVARRQGQTAGYNMAGKTARYRRGTPLNVTRLADITTTIIGMVGQREADDDLIGIVRGDSEVWREIPDAIIAQEGFDVNRIRLMLGKRHILGAVVMGDQTLSRPLYHLIDQKADITPIRDRLIQGREPIADVLAEFWTQWRARHAAATQQH